MNANLIFNFRKKAKKVVDPLCPKQPLSSYMRFCAIKRAELKSAQPELGPKDIVQALGEMWRSCDADEKLKYISEADASREKV